MSITLRKRVCESPDPRPHAKRQAFDTCEIEHGRRTVVIDSLKGNLKPFYNTLEHWGIRWTMVQEHKALRADGTYSVQRSLSVSGAAQFLDKLSEVACFVRFIYGEFGVPTGIVAENHITMRIDSRKL